MKIFITGGASGLGEAITRRLAADSMNTIYFTFNSSEEKANNLVKEFSNLKSIRLDFASHESIVAALDVISEFRPDVLVNNAITGFEQSYFHKIPVVSFERSFMLNVYPVICLTQRFISERRKLRSGKIITILTSAIINKPPIGWSEYVANKNYILSLTKSWAVENASFGITSNCISPSFLRTNLTRDTDERVIENLINENPNKSLLTEAEVAETVHFIVSTSPHLNGNNIILNAAKDIQ